jgi:hypothetical protein
MPLILSVNTFEGTDRCHARIMIIFLDIQLILKFTILSHRINSNVPVVPGPFSPRLQLTNPAWELFSLHPPSTSTVIRNVIWNSETADGGIDIGQVYY